MSASTNVVLFALMTLGGSWAYPFPVGPVVRRAGGFGALRRNDLYGQETFADRSLYGVPATRSVAGVSRSAWPFLNDYVLNRGGAPVSSPLAAASIPSGPSMTYGVPGDAIWADALLRFDESTGRLAENKPQEVVAQLLRRQEPVYADSARPFPVNVDYVTDEEEDYDGQNDFAPEMTPELSPEILSYANQIQAAEEEGPLYDTTLRMVQPQALGQNLGQAPAQIPLAALVGGNGDDRSLRFRESILPYLLVSALENEERNAAPQVPQVPQALQPRRPQIPNLPEMSQFGEIKAEVEAPEVKVPSLSDPAVLLGNAKRTKPASESVFPTQSPASPSTTSTAASTTTAATEATTSSPVKSETPKSVFQRGQEEVAMLRPPSDNRRYSNRLSALSWPKELEEDDTEEQKRQLRELPLEIAAASSSSSDADRSSSADNMIPIAHSPRKWPAALDEVDDWLAGELSQLKSRAETER